MSKPKNRTAKLIGFIALGIALVGAVTAFLVLRYMAFWKYP